MSGDDFSGFSSNPEPTSEGSAPKWYDDLPPEVRARYAEQDRVQQVRTPASAAPAFPTQQYQAPQGAYQPRLYAPVTPIPQQVAPPPSQPPVVPLVTQPAPSQYVPPQYIPPQPQIQAPQVYQAPPAYSPPAPQSPPYYQAAAPQQYATPVYAPKPVKKKSGGALVALGVILVLIAGILGGGLPAYRIVNNAISDATGGYVPNVGTGSSSPSVTSTDLSTAIWAAQQVLTSASGRTDTVDLEDKIASSQNLLAQSASSSDLGKSQGELILAAENTKRALKVIQVGEVSAEVKRKLAAGEFSSGATREDDVRNMLDTLGGTDIGVIFKDNPCGNEKAAGCVSSEDPTVMYISPLILDKKYYEDYMLLQTIAHEYGHTVHFRTGYYRVLNDGDVKAAFGDDPEHIADCMAEDIEGVVFTTYGYTCDAGQLAAARKIWTGNLSS